MAGRQVSGLQWARASTRPPGMLIARPRGAKALGVRYERELALALPGALSGQWFEFCDRNGHGWCQVDLIVKQDQLLVLLEAKHTWTPEAFRQLRGLYQPVVERALAQPVVGLQVCKNLIPGLTSTVVSDLDRGIAQALLGREVCWHWLGTPRSRSRGGRVTHLAEALAQL